MKAILCKQFEDPAKLTFESTNVPEPAVDEVLIKVSYCGLNFPDTLIVKGRYQFRPDFPFSPGQEVSGEIVKVGELAQPFRVGDRVLASMTWGGMAEFAVAKAINTYPLPSDVKMPEAASLLESYGTSIHALKDRAELKPGETLLVLGASGGTGTAAVQLGKLFGCRVIGVASSAKKREFVLKNGADQVLDYPNLKHNLKEIGGVDVVFDPVGGKISEEAFRTIRPGGRYLIVGFASGEIPTIGLNLPLLKSASIVGVFWGSFWRLQPVENRRNVRLLLKWIQAGKLTVPVTVILPLAEAAEALSQMEKRTAQGKIVLKV